MVLFMTGLVLVAPALVRPLSLVFGALLAALFARHGTGTLAQNNLARQPSRAAVTASTTMIALAVIVAMGGFMVSVSDGFLGILRTSLGSDYLFVPPAVGLWQNNVGATGSFADALRGTQGVGAVSTLRYAAAIVDLPAGAGKAGGKAFGKASAKAPAMAPGAPTADESAASAGNTVSVLGIDPATFPLVSSLSFTDGEPGKAYADLAAGRSAILNPALAASLGLKSGALMTLQTPDGPREYRVTGVATDFLDAKIAAMFISQANLASDFHKTEDVLIQLNLKPGADAAAADTAIRAAGSDYPQFSIIQGKEYYNEMSRMFTAVFAMLYVLFGFLALPSLLTTLNTLAISVIERTREIGMLRAVGTTKKQVSRTVLAEGLLLAAIGTAFGLLAGLYLGYLLVKAMASAGFPVMYIFPWGGIASAVIVGLLFGALAAIIPSRKAAGLEIVQALRYE
jgi:putative ABC transport system permease protein